MGDFRKLVTFAKLIIFPKFKNQNAKYAQSDHLSNGTLFPLKQLISYKQLLIITHANNRT